MEVPPSPPVLDLTALLATKAFSEEDLAHNRRGVSRRPTMPASAALAMRRRKGPEEELLPSDPALRRGEAPALVRHDILLREREARPIKIPSRRKTPSGPRGSARREVLA
jgi:hypothetical protein